MFTWVSATIEMNFDTHLNSVEIHKNKYFPLFSNISYLSSPLLSSVKKCVRENLNLRVSLKRMSKKTGTSGQVCV